MGISTGDIPIRSESIVGDLSATNDGAETTTAEGLQNGKLNLFKLF